MDESSKNTYNTYSNYKSLPDSSKNEIVQTKDELEGTDTITVQISNAFFEEFEF